MHSSFVRLLLQVSRKGNKHLVLYSIDIPIDLQILEGVVCWR